VLELVHDRLYSCFAWRHGHYAPLIEGLTAGVRGELVLGLATAFFMGLFFRAPASLWLMARIPTLLIMGFFGILSGTPVKL
jgi:hypothetical protein